ncbi:hypothetical protein LSH36_359g02016 [Paralvinella palmiformis]|uniref:Uncharacterized protein n=1 Tax=Paralvinella palmiformis TaxID=53620 RepID=A0AAD9JF97_9ANNE|nr:hypothetical protein LSH36_359g02016 [Paralvinella palmiformis]
MQKFVENGDVSVSGTLENVDLGLSTTFFRKCSIGGIFGFCYDGSPDSNIIKAHLAKLTDTFRTVFSNMNAHNKTTEGGTSIKSASMLKFSILFPDTADRLEIMDFLANTFHCKVFDEHWSALGLYEIPF